MSYWLINNAISGACGHVSEHGYAIFLFLVDGLPLSLGDQYDLNPPPELTRMLLDQFASLLVVLAPTRISLRW